MFSIRSLTAIFLFASTGLAGPVMAEEINIYSSQKEHLIRPVLDDFTEATGIDVNLTTGGKSELVARLEHEGEHTPADLLLTVDIGNIYTAKEKGLLQPIESETLNAQIPDNLRDPEGYWYGVTIRSRAIYYNKELVDPEEAPKTYEELADPKWRGKLLIRSSENVYNQSLVASMLAHHGHDETLEWAEGVVANMARPPQGGDTDQLKALAAGEGAIAVANTYYYGRLIAGAPDIQDESVKEKVAIVFANQDGRGAHVNIRGGGVTSHAKHKESAIKLLEYLAGDDAQHFFAEGNFEYPAKPSIAPAETVQSWGELKRDPINLEEVGKHHKEAVAIMQEAGWQ